MRHALVTGGAGCIGSALCHRLLTSGLQVTAVDNLITSDGNNLKKLKKNKRFTFIKYDITKHFTPANKSKLSSLDYIYHLACPTGVSNLVPMAEEMLLTCSEGTRNILELAKSNDARMVFTSSSEVYGDPQKFPQDESYNGNVSAIDTRSPYEEGKRFAEALCAMYARKYSVNVTIARVFNTYGPGASATESRVIPRFLRTVLAGKPIPVAGDGRQTRTFCYVDDLIDGLVLLIKKGKRGQVYNLGGDKEISIFDLAKQIIYLTHSKSIIICVPRPVHDHQRRRPNLSKIKKLGWKQKVSLNEGLKRTIESYSRDSGR